MEPDRVNACTFVGKRSFLFAQTHLDVNLDVDSTVDAKLDAKSNLMDAA